MALKTADPSHIDSADPHYPYDETHIGQTELTPSYRVDLRPAEIFYTKNHPVLG